MFPTWLVLKLDTGWLNACASPNMPSIFVTWLVLKFDTD